MQKNQKTTNHFAVTVVSTIFFMWGFLTCLNDILIPHLKAIFNLTYTESALIQFTFFGAYFIMSLPAGKIVTKRGYKKSISLGLLIAAVGAALFYPAAKYEIYALFLGALFVLASGITVLQVAANPYVSLLGPEETAPSRLNLAQALNSLGTTLAPFFGSVLILSSAAVLSQEQLGQMSANDVLAYKVSQAQSVQGPYLLLAGVLVLLAVIIFVFKLPNFPGERGATQSQSKQSFMEVLKIPHVLFGVLGIFVYVGAEVSIGSFMINYFALPHIGNMTEASAAKLITFYWGGAMVGRFIGSALMQKLDAGKMLGTAALVATLFVGLSIVSGGQIAIWSLVLVGLFNSIMFPTIFSLGIRGLGSQTEKASSLLIMAIVGGALIPLFYGMLADRIGLQLAFLLPMLCYLYIAFYGFKGSRV